jgi:hypothetical protein
MTEGIIGAILGDIDEMREFEASQELAGADAFATAVAARPCASDPKVAKVAKVAAFLDEQMHLVRVQAKNLKDEHAARLHHLQSQARKVAVRRFGLRLLVGHWVAELLLATIAVAGSVLSVWYLRRI